jgi:hypothetical protein
VQIRIHAALWLILTLGFLVPTLVGAETTILFTANSLGEFNPCPS